jgi:anti-anti-sigma regulatory factor
MAYGMFRITKAFANETTEIFRIEGQVSDDYIGDWITEIDLLKKDHSRTVILDFAQVWFISTKAVQALMGALTDQCYVMNCGMEIRNILYVSGLSSRMLG